MSDPVQPVDNFNSLTPVPPAGENNIIFQADTNNPRNISAYSPVANAPMVIGFIMATGATGTNVGPDLVAPRSGTVTKCKIVTKASDASTDLTIKIKQNGVDVFSVDPTVTHGTASGTVSTFTALSPSPLPVTADDVFTIDIMSGTSTWQFTVQLES